MIVATFMTNGSVILIFHFGQRYTWGGVLALMHFSAQLDKCDGFLEREREKEKGYVSLFSVLFWFCYISFFFIFERLLYTFP